MKAEVKRVSRREFLRCAVVMAGITVGLPLLGACGPPAAPAPTKPAAPAAKQPVKLTIWTFLDTVTGKDSRGRVVKIMTDKFLAKYSHISVDFEVTPWPQLGSKYQAAFEAGNAPDITWVRNDWIQRHARQGSLADLNKWMSKWPESERNDYYSENVWNIGVVGDKRLVHKLHLTGGLIYYRRDIAAKAGISDEQMRNLRTWDQWIEAAKKMTFDKNGRSLGSPGFAASEVATWGYGSGRARRGGTGFPFEHTLLGLGVKEMTDEGYANWVSPEGEKTLELWTSLITKHRVQSPHDLTYDYEAGSNNYIAGLYAMQDQGSHRWVDYHDKVKTWDGNQMALAFWPTFDGKNWGPVSVSGWNIGISSQSKRQDEAWLWFENQISREGDLLMVTEGGQLPVRKSTMESEALKKPELAYARTFLEAMSSGSYESRRSELPVDPTEDLQIAFHEVVQDKVQPLVALQKAADRHNQKVRQILQK